MCGRYVSPGEGEIERLFHIGRTGGNPYGPFTRRFNVAPTMTVPLLHREPGLEGYALEGARWSLVPHWWRQAKPPRFTHNARAEEAAGKPMWRDALRHGRCLIPAEGWYEWQEVEQLDPATGEVRKGKQPHYIQVPDGMLVCFAGVMSRWTPPANDEAPAGDPVLTCAMLTIDAAPSVAGVHERMPVVLDLEGYEAWLDPSVEDAARAVALARAHMQTEFVHHPVSQRLNTRGADDEGLCAPLDPPA